MREETAQLEALVAALTVSVAAQTTVTTAGGTTHTVPVFTGSVTLGNSLIADSGSNVGILTTSPQAGLDIEESSDPITGGPVLGLNVNNTITVGSTTDYPQNSLITKYSGSGTQSFLYGLTSQAINAGTGSVSNGYSTLFRVVNSSSSGSIANGFGVYVDTPQGGGPISNAYGVTINPQKVSGVTTGYGVVQYGASDINSFAGNVGIGTTNPSRALEVNGTAQIDNGLYFPGSATPQTTPWTGVLCGGDYAEAMNEAAGKAKYEPGDVLVLSSTDSDDVEKPADPHSTMVAGIYAIKPGVIGRREALTNSKEDIPMVMVGVVPTKVSAENGAIHRGDLLVSSSTSGYAMKGTDRNKLLGAVIGKAMGSLDSGTGVIEVLVTLQ